MVNAISIIGSTGSIGRQTEDVAIRLGIPVKAIAANRDVDQLERQARTLHPELIAVSDEYAAEELKRRLSGSDIKIISGENSLTEVAIYPECDCVVTAVSGSVGLKPTMAAIRAQRRIALANKETLVCAGDIVMREAEKYKAEILPVDSEHSAIFQCLTGRGTDELKRILLTASGGPFRGRKWSDTANITPEQAVKHPNWSMGAKISVDSATMMNKGLEFIEAMHLFHVTPQQIKVVIHPESVIHSMVELVDGAVIAQCGTADMRLPIQYALTWPQRCEHGADTLDFASLKTLHFEEPDPDNSPCMFLAMDCAGRKGTYCAVLSAANEVAVGAFLGHRIAYNAIYELVYRAVSDIAVSGDTDLEQLFDADIHARSYVNELINKHYGN